MKHFNDIKEGDIIYRVNNDQNGTIICDKCKSIKDQYYIQGYIQDGDADVYRCFSGTVCTTIIPKTQLNTSRFSQVCSDIKEAITLHNEIRRKRMESQFKMELLLLESKKELLESIIAKEEEQLANGKEPFVNMFGGISFK